MWMIYLEWNISFTDTYLFTRFPDVRKILCDVGKVKADWNWIVEHTVDAIIKRSGSVVLHPENID